MSTGMGIVVGLIALAVCMIGVFFLVLLIRSQERKLRMTEGRTIREFQSEKNVWEILDRWAEIRKYKIVKQNGCSRLYRSKPRGYFSLIAGTNVRMIETDRGYLLEAWVSLRKGSVIAGIVMPMPPKDINMEKRSQWPYALEPLDHARSDVNNLLEMLDAGIDLIQ